MITTAVPAFACSSSPKANDDVLHYGINELNPEDFIAAPPIVTSHAQSGYISFLFDGCRQEEVYSDFVEFYFSAGSSATLDVNVCTWKPEGNPIEIGVYNWSTGQNWYYIKRDGKFSGYLFFNNLPSGRYSAYVRNKGSNTLQSGYISYSLS